MIPIIVVQEEVLFREMPKELTSTVGRQLFENEILLRWEDNSKEKKALSPIFTN